MNKTLKFALAAVLGVGLVLPATAQDNFPDVPENHWAFEALAALKGSVLFGYPDGLYRGNRPTSRYEFAVALHQIWMKMSGQVDSLQDQIDRLNEAIRNLPTGGNGTDPALRNAIDALRRDVDAIKGWQTDIENFRKLATEFERELAGFGVTLDRVQADLAALEGRVSTLENQRNKVTIGGDAVIAILAGHSTEGDFGLGVDGRIYGAGNQFPLNPVGITRDLNVLHELGLNIHADVNDNVTVDGTLVTGNTFGQYGGFNNRNQGVPYADIVGSEIWVHNLSVNFRSSLAGQGFNARMGRVGKNVGKFLLRRSDFTPELEMERWDNGEFTFDGGIFGFQFGNVGLEVFGGRVSSVTINGSATQLNPMAMNFGDPSAQVDSLLGVQAMLGLGSNGRLNLAYIIQDSNINPTVNGGINRVSTYGADASFNFSGIGFDARFAQTVAGAGDNSIIDTNNTAWEAALNWGSGDRWGLQAGYRSVERNFRAYGSWERLGTIWTPVNVEGFFGNLWFNPNGALSFYANAQFMNGIDNGNTIATMGPVFGQDDDVLAFKVGVNYELADNWGFMASYEDVRWNFDVGTQPTQRWFNVGFNYGLGENSSILISYLFSDVDFKGRQAEFGFANPRYRGGLLGTSLRIRF